MKLRSAGRLQQAATLMKREADHMERIKIGLTVTSKRPRVSRAGPQKGISAKTKIKTEIESEIKREIKSEIKNEIQSEIKSEIKSDTIENDRVNETFNIYENGHKRNENGKQNGNENQNEIVNENLKSKDKHGLANGDADVNNLILKAEAGVNLKLNPLRVLKNTSIYNNNAALTTKLLLISTNEIEAEVAANIFSKVTESDKSDIQPPKWDLIYNRIVDMRSRFIAPVDTMGCERIPEQINPNIRLNPVIFRFQLLILLMLSSQTKDEVNYAAILNLNQYFQKNGFVDGLSIEAVLETDEQIIDDLIGKVGFHRRKAGYMKKSCEILRDNFESDIPKSIQEIVTLPGVGPKMGYLLLHKAWKINLGIGVDVHLHRLSQMWRWLPVANNPESTRKALQEWFPKRLWGEINPLLVGFGQMVCDSQSPNCDICSLSSGLCSSVKRKIVNQRGSKERLAKLKRARGDLTQLITDIEDLV